VEAVFAFVFGRGDPNADLELRRWRAIGMLLRACQGAVFAEQVAPFLDTYLLQRHAGGPRFSPLRLFARSRGQGDEPRDTQRMHEGFMLPVLARFEGHAEASDDGRLVYIFPALRVTASGASSGAAPAPHLFAAPPPVAPPLYERVWPLADGGDKQPLVITLGVANAMMLLLFRSIGGMEFADPAAMSAAEAQARARARAKALGRRAGGGFAAEAHSERREVDPTTLRVLSAIPWLAAKLWPLLAAYAFVFFLAPALRCAWAWRENKALAARNATRKRAAGEALAAALAAVEDGRAAAAARLRAPIVIVAGEP
jgi:hypothetical protein